MHVYAVYDQTTGEILHTYASYVLGRDEPVAATPEEVLQSVPEPPPGADLAVAPVPDDFDPRGRNTTLEFDADTATVRAVALRRPSEASAPLEVQR